MTLRASLYALGGVMLVAVLVWALFNFDPFGRLKRAKAEAAVAVQQADNNGEAVRQVDRFHERTIVIQSKAQEAQHAIEAAPGGDEPLDPVRRDALCDALSRMRDGAQVCTD